MQCVALRGFSILLEKIPVGKLLQLLHTNSVCLLGCMYCYATNVLHETT